MRKFIGKFLAAGLCVAMVLSSVTVKADSVDQKYQMIGDPSGNIRRFF